MIEWLTRSCLEECEKVVSDFLLCGGFPLSFQFLPSLANGYSQFRLNIAEKLTKIEIQYSTQPVYLDAVLSLKYFGKCKF